MEHNDAMDHDIVSEAENVRLVTDTRSRGGAKDDINNVDTGRVSGSSLSQRGFPRCGCFNWRPNWLQKCYNKYMALFVICWVSFSQSVMVNGFNNGNVLFYERRFQIESYQAGFISSAYDLTAGGFSIIVAYYGNLGRKPRWLAWSALLYAVSALVMYLPHKIAPIYSPPEMTCEAFDCENAGDVRYYVLIVMGGMAIGGIAASIMYSLGTGFIDDMVPAKTSALYVSIFYSVAALGPVVGFILSGVFNNIWVNLGETPPVDRTDPSWVGAWWIGFLLCFLLLVPATVIFFMFDYELPEAAIVRQTRMDESHRNAKESEQAQNDHDELQRASFGKSIRDLPLATKIIITNPVFMSMTMCGAMEGAILAGFTTFLPAFLSRQFFIRDDNANFITGTVIIPAAVLSQILCGYYVKVMALKIRGMLLTMSIAHFCVLLMLPILLLHCDTPPIAGVTTPYEQSSTAFEMNSFAHLEYEEDASLYQQCNAAQNGSCDCSTGIFKPVCLQGKMQYFNRCFAGCSGNNVSSSCSCLNMTGIIDGDIEIVEERCPNGCMEIYLFLVVFFLIVFGMFFVQVPISMITLRSVAPKQRSYSLGIQWTFIRFMGTLPGPVLFGKLLDHACLVWRVDQCGTNGQCWVQDNQLAAVGVMILIFILKFLSFAFTLFGLKKYQPPSNIDANDRVSKFFICCYKQTDQRAIISEEEEDAEEEGSRGRRVSRLSIGTPPGEEPNLNVSHNLSELIEDVYSLGSMTRPVTPIDRQMNFNMHTSLQLQQLQYNKLEENDEEDDC